MRKLSCLLFAVVVLCCGCDAVNDMKDMFSKQGMVQDAIKEQNGLDSQVGFNINNGILTQVTVGLESDQVREKPVSELEHIAQDAVATAFASTPRGINIQVACRPKKKGT